MPVLTFIHSDGRRKDFNLKTSPIEAHHLSVTNGSGTYYLDLTSNTSISDTSVVFTGHGLTLYPRTIYVVDFPNVGFQSPGSIPTTEYVVHMDSTANGVTIRVRCGFCFRPGGAVDYADYSCEAIQGPKPKKITLHVTHPNVGSRTFEFPGNTTLDRKQRWEGGAPWQRQYNTVRLVVEM